MATYDWLQSAQVMEVAQEYRQLEIDKFAPDPIFKLFPMETTDAPILQWDQLDNDAGLMQVSAYDGPYVNVQHTTGKEWLAKPGVYKEQYIVSEKDLTNQRRRGTFGEQADMAYHVDRGIIQLTGRYQARHKQIGWLLASSGTFAVTNSSGVVVHTDTYNVATYKTPIAWSSASTATPIIDFQNAALLGRGKGVSFMADATAYMNLATFQKLVQNSNANDFGGLRAKFGNTIKYLDAQGINGILTSFMIPNIVVWDFGYYDETTKAYTFYIPNNKVVVVGNRYTGEPLGAMRETYNAALKAGGWFLNVDMDKEPPYLPRIFSQVNFGPVLYYPSNLMWIDVS